MTGRQVPSALSRCCSMARASQCLMPCGRRNALRRDAHMLWHVQHMLCLATYAGICHAAEVTGW